jgi:hypothetical protein
MTITPSNSSEFLNSPQSEKSAEQATKENEARANEEVQKSREDQAEAEKKQSENVSQERLLDVYA